MIFAARASAGPGKITVHQRAISQGNEGSAMGTVVPGRGWSAVRTAWIGGIPKLIVRVRFSSPAPTENTLKRSHEASLLARARGVPMEALGFGAPAHLVSDHLVL